MKRVLLFLLAVGMVSAAGAFHAVESGWWERRVESTWRMLAERDPRVLYYVETSRPAVALTIDDGPDPESTPAILDTLARHDTRATFFLISDHVSGNEGLVRRIVKEGHEIANHLTRDKPSIDLGRDEFERQLLEAHGALSQFQAPAWFRPGSGWYDDHMLAVLHEHGYRVVLGDSLPMDIALRAPGLISRYFAWNVEPGSIIILHDGGRRGANTARALDRLLPELRAEGYEVTTLSALAGEGVPGH